jgi:hypothetical protein
VSNRMLFGNQFVALPYIILYQTNQTIKYAFGSSAPSYIQVSTGNILAVGTWAHIVMVYNGGSSVLGVSGNVKIYCNAVLQVYGAESISGTVNTSCKVGDFYLAGADNTYDYDGKMDQVLVYNRELSAAEVALLYGEYDGYNF